jgi:hypothetical protein
VNSAVSFFVRCNSPYDDVCFFVRRTVRRKGTVDRVPFGFLKDSSSPLFPYPRETLGRFPSLRGHSGKGGGIESGGIDQFYRNEWKARNDTWWNPVKEQQELRGHQAPTMLPPNMVPWLFYYALLVLVRWFSDTSHQFWKDNYECRWICQ